MKNRILIIFLLIAFISEAQNVISLYPDKAPGSEHWNWQEKKILTDTTHQWHTVYNVVEPTLTVYTPEKTLNNGTSVIICPGGGFHHLAINKEGTAVAKWLNSIGITAFVFKYRLVKSQFDASGKAIRFSTANRKRFDSIIAPIVSFAINDASKSIKYIRDNADKYNLKKDRIGIMGFSAGGTVATGTVYSPDGAGSRPNFVVPIYAFTDPLKEIEVPSDAPPAFIVAAADDLLVPATSSTKLFNDWVAAGKSAEMHIYSKGGHGFGMQKKSLPVDGWINRFQDWLDAHGYLNDTK